MKKLSFQQRNWLIKKAKSSLKKRARRMIVRSLRNDEFNKIIADNRNIYIDNGFIAPDKPIHRPIFIPENLSIWNNYAETINAFEEIRNHGLRDRRPIIIHLGRVDEFDQA